MNGAIGAILPLAVGIAVSPIPIIAAILMLLSPKARATSVAFMIGWVAGIVVGSVVFTLLSAILPASAPDTAHPVIGVVQLLLGVILLLLAVRQWRSRPKDGATGTMPKWMSSIDAMTPARGAVLGFLLSAVNPKNLVMSIAAGTAVGGAALAVWQSAIVIAIFVILASLSVALPVVGFLVAGERLRPALDRLQVWLTDNNSVIMAVLFLVLGVVVIGKGIGQF
jgi:threonine/homoserine/homoserine lactone efflux protein